MALGKMYRVPRNAVAVTPVRGSKRVRRGQLATKGYVDRRLANEIETKEQLFNRSGQVITTSGLVDDISAILPADRIGNDVKLKSLHIRWEVTAGQSSFLAPDAYNTLRLIIFRWKDDDANHAPLMGDILSSIGATPTLYPYNYTKRTSYHIIYDHVLNVGNNAVFDGTQVDYFSGYDSNKHGPTRIFSGKKLGIKTIYFNDSTSTGTNKIYWLAVSDSLLTPSPTLDLVGALYYSD